MIKEMIEDINTADEVYRNTLDKNQNKFNTAISEYSYVAAKDHPMLTKAEEKLNDCMIAYDTALEAFENEVEDSVVYGNHISPVLVANYNRCLSDRDSARKHYDQVYDKYLQQKQADYDTFYDDQQHILSYENYLALNIYNETNMNNKQTEKDVVTIEMFEYTENYLALNIYNETNMNNKQTEKDVVDDNTEYTIEMFEYTFEMYARALGHAVLAEKNAAFARNAVEAGHVALTAAADAAGFAYLNAERSDYYQEKCCDATKEALKADKDALKADKDATDALTKYIAKVQQ